VQVKESSIWGCRIHQEEINMIHCDDEIDQAMKTYTPPTWVKPSGADEEAIINMAQHLNKFSNRFQFDWHFNAFCINRVREFQDRYPAESPDDYTDTLLHFIYDEVFPIVQAMPLVDVNFITCPECKSRVNAHYTAKYDESDRAGRYNYIDYHVCPVCKARIGRAAAKEE
jgi:hypothetical protein